MCTVPSVTVAFAFILCSALDADAFQTSGSLAFARSVPPRDTTSVASASIDSEEEGSAAGDVSIVYCTGCRWMLRSAYYAQELLTTFEHDLNSVTLIPSRPPLPGGMLFVTLDGEKIWDRKERGRFPQTKELKQLVRDVICPDRGLGHSDISDKGGNTAQLVKEGEKCEECPDDGEEVMEIPEYGDSRDYFLAKSPHVTIKYCTGCKWLLRAAWDAQELLTTFQDDLSAVTVAPTQEPAGQFVVLLDDVVIWDRAAEGRHAEPKELKQRIRDIISPNRSLGHSDVKEKEEQRDASDDTGIEELDDDEASEMRNFYGVM
mmetsp:Transcript_19747/g.40096  ORF Transcript_19747/g.40096 Transcript_19747/m.40096 type:complete len:318 (+) Transcript_19747:674-1627(+)